jgi:membrane associated rhomboid family serine protease
MGIADRDYARQPRRGGMGGGGMVGMGGGFGVWSFNTWLIVVNVVVFVIGGMVMSVPAFRGPVWSAVQFEPTATAEQRARAVVLSNAYDRAGPRVQAVPVIDPQTAATDPLGRVVVDRTGQPLPAQIGVQPVRNATLLESWGHFSTAKAFLGIEVWRFVSFQFLHANTVHLVFNMLGLFFVGGLVEQYLGSKRYAAFYLTCGVFGAVLYLLLNLLGHMMPNAGLPGLLFDDTYTPLVGASAGIFGVLMAAAYIAPRAEVAIFGIIPMKMRTAVYGFTLIAAANLLLGGSNQGGDAAHIGGAIAGFFFIRRMHLLRDFFDVFGDSRGRAGR